MQWHRLFPLNPEDCRYRSQVEGELATCDLVRAALPEGNGEVGRVTRATCLVCCKAAPATLTTWNPVVGSLVYVAASALLNDPATRPQAEAARARALPYLDAVGSRRAHEPREPVRDFVSLRELIPLPAKRHREPIRKWAVGVTTAPRRRPTLELCLARLARAGWEAPHLFMDSEVRISEAFSRLQGTLRSPAIGAWPNHYLALAELLMRQPDADAFLIMQDDALIYDGENVREYLEQALWPGRTFPIVSLYCPMPYNGPHYGWHRFRRWWVWGAQAFLFSRAAAQMYLCDRRICEHRWRSAQGGLKQIDVLIGRWARRRGIPLWFPTPSLVQHIGETSTLWPNAPIAGRRAATLFVGDPPPDR